MHSHFRRAAAFALALLSPLALAAPLTLEAALGQAVRRSQAVRAAQAGAASARQMAQTASQLPDPMLSIGIENLPATGPDRLSTTREGMTMKRIALSQEWIAADKRALRAAAAARLAEREQAVQHIAVAETRLQTVLAYLDAFYAAQGRELAAQGEAYAREASGLARARLAAGSTGAQDALSQASALGVAADELALQQQLAAAASVNLARWTGAPADDLQTPVLDTQARTEQAYVDAHPLVVLRQGELEAARAEAAVAATNRRPNWTWEVAYGQRAGAPDLLSVGLSIPLPVVPAARQDREAAARQALADKAEAELAEAVRAAQAEYRVLDSDAQRLRARLQTYERAVLATAAQRSAVALASYQGNREGLSVVFEARYAELEARRRLLALQRELARVLAQLAFKPVSMSEAQ